MRGRRRPLLIVGGLLALVGFGACSAPPNGSVTSVRIDQDLPLYLEIGATVDVSATVAVTGSASTKVLWTSNDLDVAAVSDEGKVTAMTGGATSIAATSVADPEQSDALAVTVWREPSGVESWWADVQFSGPASGTGIAEGADGYVYVVGSTSGALLLPEPMMNIGANDAFIAKTAAGEVRWAMQFGTPQSDYASGIAIDDTKATVYVAGNSFGDIADDGRSPGTLEPFVMRLDAREVALTVDWTIRIGGTDGGELKSVVVDAFGDVIVGGHTYGNVALDDCVTTPSGNVDVFVMKLDSDGTCLWAAQFGGPTNAFAEQVAVDRDGDVLVTGYVYGDIDPTDPATDHLGETDAFLVKRSGVDGSPLWSRQFGSDSADDGYALAVDRFGGIVVFGETTAELGPSATLDVFLAPFDGQGTPINQWKRGSTHYASVGGVAVDQSGTFFVVGTTNDTDDASAQVFVARYDPDRSLRWEQRLDGVVLAHALAMTPGGDLAVALTRDNEVVVQVMLR
jgi:hypothetical protein